MTDRTYTNLTPPDPVSTLKRDSVSHSPSEIDAWFDRFQHRMHEEFHSYEGAKEDCDEGYCREVNPLRALAREQDAIRAELLDLARGAEHLFRGEKYYSEFAGADQLALWRDEFYRLTDFGRVFGDYHAEAHRAAIEKAEAALSEVKS